MANGHDRNLVRLILALEGFRALHGHWPQRVLLEKDYIKDFKQLLTEHSYKQLISKVDLIASRTEGMRAEDDQGNSFTYGVDEAPETPRDINADHWLGGLEMKPYDEDPF